MVPIQPACGHGAEDLSSASTVNAFTAYKVSLYWYCCPTFATLPCPTFATPFTTATGVLIGLDSVVDKFTSNPQFKIYSGGGIRKLLEILCIVNDTSLMKGDNERWQVS
jgi:hypothetical protein